MSEQRPIHEIRLGRVKAAIWENETERGVRYSVSISRIYRIENRWESSTSFGREELPLVAKVADLAHTWIYQQSREANQASRSDSQEPATSAS